jgi:dipeptidyl aminopeptidase/acylaminoacyl peptidase
VRRGVVDDARVRTSHIALATALAVLVVSARGAAADDAYRPAPSPVREVLRAPGTPVVMVSPDGRWALAATYPKYPPIAELAAPMLRLGGVRLDPRTNGFHAWSHFRGGYTVRRLPDGPEVAIRMPKDLKFGSAYWNATSTRFAFVSIAAGSIELWVGDPAKATVRKVNGVAVNPLLGNQLQWLSDGRTLAVKTVPLRRKPAPAEAPPSGPIIQDASGVGTASSTYEARDLLRNAYDADLFEHYMTSQLALVDAATAKVTRIGAAGVIGNVQAAPDGKHLLVTRVVRPYSYARPWHRFPREVELWARDGKRVETVASLPLADQVPIEGVPVGPREFRFDPTQPATLVWVEALDRGDWAVTVPRRDRLMRKELGKPATAWRDVERRFAGIDWVEGGDLIAISEWDRDKRWEWMHVGGLDGTSAMTTIVDRSFNDAYADPGTPLYEVLPTGGYVIRREGDAIFWSGEGATPTGNRPFLDRMSLKTRQRERVWQSAAGRLERFKAWIDAGAGTFVTMGESPTEPPNLELRTLGDATVKRLTSHPDPTPQVRGVTKQLVTARRADGVQVNVTLYLPPGYVKGTKLPTVFYAYPLEYSDAATAGQVTTSPTEFTTPWGAAVELYALAGYAVLDVSMPVVGPPETVYDSFVEQIVGNAKAAIDKAVEMGVTDRDRVGVTGHSHGALMTANLLAYSNLFRAGIARSGAYNHTLRPFGFQSEHRTYFKARATYQKLSPTLNADKIDEPLLLIHGAIDVNPGTVPLQSEKLYEAVRGAGGTTRLVMLPFESHGYRAIESIEHVMAEQIEWFDRYVKAAKPRAGAATKK